MRVCGRRRRSFDFLRHLHASCQVIEWLATKSAEEVNAFRIDVIESLEEAHAAMTTSGARRASLRRSHPTVRRISRRANPLLLEKLLLATGYKDVACVNLLRKGVLHTCAGCPPILIVFPMFPCVQVQQCSVSCHEAASGDLLHPLR